MTYEFSTKKDHTLHIMGMTGMTADYPIKRKQLVTYISDILDVGSQKANAAFNAHTASKTASPSITPCLNDSEGNVTYVFTQEGYESYQKLTRVIEDAEQGTVLRFNQWARKYYPGFEGNFQESLDKDKSYMEIDFDKLTHFTGLVADEKEILTDYAKVCDRLKDYIFPKIDALFGTDPEYKELLSNFHIRITGIPEKYITKVENVFDHDIGDFIAVGGMVREISSVDKSLEVAVYKCLRCEHEHRIPQEVHKEIVAPTYCENESCGKKGPFKLIDDDSKWGNVQITLIHSNTQLNGSAKIKCIGTGDLCTGSVERMGKNVIITGNLQKDQKMTKQNKKSSTFAHVLVIKNIIDTDDSITSYPTNEECAMFDELAAEKTPAGLSIVHEDVFVRNCAPNIYGREEVKNIVTLTLFSDWNWNSRMNGGDRSSLNCLLFGTPGTGKSDILKDLLRISPKGFGPDTFKAGQMSSGVGLTSTNQRSEIDGRWMVQPGFLALGDKSVVGIDEIDKIPNGDVEAIAPVLEDQRQDIGKAASGQFHSRCAVIMTANPDGGAEIDPTIPVIDQFSSGLFLKQRIDFIVAMPEMDDIEDIRKASRSVTRAYSRTTQENACSIGSDPHSLKRSLDVDTIRKYILYARSKPCPIMPDDVADMLDDYYMEIKTARVGSHISLRTLKSLLRTATAIARRELASEVSFAHATEAIRIMEYAVRSVSGTTDEQFVNYTAIEAGRSNDMNNKISTVKKFIRAGHNEEMIYTLCMNEGMEKDHISGVIMNLKREGNIFEAAKGVFHLS